MDALQSASAANPDIPEPVIAVFSDHDYYYDQADSQARFGNFVAVSTHGAGGLLDDSPTLVNDLAILMDRYLRDDFPLSADRCFMSPGRLLSWS